MMFNSHGFFQFTVEDNLLIIEGKGPWNKEAIIRSNKGASEIIKQLYGRKWGVLGIFHGEPIFIPGAVDALIEVVSIGKRHGRIASALILDEAVHADMGFYHISKIYRKAGEKFKFFDDIESAKKWLKLQIENS